MIREAAFRTDISIRRGGSDGVEGKRLVTRNSNNIAVSEILEVEVLGVGE